MQIPERQTVNNLAVNQLITHTVCHGVTRVQTPRFSYLRRFVFKASFLHASMC